jgi:predicted nuclease of restriction endonuclease-like RecB superfamily
VVGFRAVLTSDLIQVRKKGDLCVPRWLDGAQRERLRPVVATYLAVASASVGKTRDVVESSWSEVPVGVRDRTAAAGLLKLVEDRCTFEGGDESAAQSLRAEVFLAAAAARSALGPTDGFDRDAILAAVATGRSATVEAVEAGLFADLRSAERLVAWDAVDADGILDGYDVALAQAVLLRASRVVIEIRGESAERHRRLFRAASFHGLLHAVTPLATGGHRIELDGPMSVFDSVQRYGLRLAFFFPHVLACRDFKLEADLLWGPKREHRRLVIEPALGLVPSRRDVDLPDLRPEVEALLGAWEALRSPWKASACDRLLAIPGEVVVAPDVTFEDTRSGEEVFLEVFGFWSRAAVFKRVEQVRRGMGGRVILAVGKHLRVSEDLLGEDDAGEIHVYKTAISAKAILERLERGAQPEKKTKAGAKTGATAGAKAGRGKKVAS